MRFRAELLNTDGMRSALDAEAPQGRVEFMVATFDVPDRSVAVGNAERQVIDRGAFRSWIDGGSFRENTVPIYADHAEAYRDGIMRATLKLGYADDFEESHDGLVVRGSYNLNKQLGREMFSDLLHDPRGAQFSFRWPPDEKTFRAEDGVEHVVEFSGIEEVSQVGRGAGVTKLLSARSAIESWGWTAEEVAALLSNENFRTEIVPLIAADESLRSEVRQAIADAEAPDPLASWERAVWDATIH